MSEPTLLERINRLPQTDDKTDPHILQAREYHARSHMAWHEEEEQILMCLANKGTSLNYISKQLKRSCHAIETRVKALGGELKKQNQPTNNNEESAPLIDNKKNLSNKEESNEAKKVLQYWRNCLADADKMGLPIDKMKEGQEFTLEQFKSGRLPALKIKRFFDVAEEEIRKKNKKRKKYQRKDKKQQEEKVVLEKLTTLIAPYTLVKNHEHGTKIGGEVSPKELSPLWLTADITRAGELLPCKEPSYPWIERRCLTPNEAHLNTLAFPIIGDVTQVDKFYSHNTDLFSEGEQTWKALFSYAEDLFSKLLAAQPDILLKQNFSRISKGYILCITNMKGVSTGLITTYDQYISGSPDKIPKIVTHFCALTDEKPLADLPEETLFTASEHHLGQIQQQYPLAATQRRSLSYFNAMKNNSVFTIHGPPGTGKTTLLLSVIVSQWIEAAIQKKFPPIIVAASTNNLAIINILNHFKEDGHENSSEKLTRWLPDFDCYGLYLAPGHKETSAKDSGFCYRLKQDNFSSLSPLYTVEYRLKAKAHFLSQHNQYFKKNETDLKRCQQFIHKKILEKQHLLQKTIYLTRDIYFTTKQYNGIEALNKTITEKESQKTTIKEKLDDLKKIQIEWLSFKTNQLKWPRIFKWIPLGRSLLEDRIKLFTSRFTETFSKTIYDLETADLFLIEAISKKENEYNKIKDDVNKLQSVKEKYERLYEDKITLEKRLDFKISVEDIFDFTSPTNILSKLDQTLRYELFILAIHYWEATWLLESDILNILKHNLEGRKKYWQIQAMLTPYFVTTLHSGPGFFQYKAPSQSFETLVDFIDLLIVDEAGQVMPATAGAMVSTAKKVLLVGDPKQIEPITALTEGIDLANAKKYGLCKDENDYERMKKKGILCSGDPKTAHAYGNLITLGQRKSLYHLKNHAAPGMLLTEHRRCPKDVISYCNELCYDNQLQILTVEGLCLYPHMGYAHIKGDEKKRGSSRFNKPEAETIVLWLLKNKEKILSTCKEDNIDKCVGIITPYTAQSNIIKNLLSKHDLNVRKVGTVHSLQGAQKPIIIFSSVCIADEKSGVHFFDKSPNMLNVAVSRAKQSFLVFGDMDIFERNKESLPSSLLAKYLFAKEDNEILDIIQPKFNALKYEENEKIRQITTLEQHQEALKWVFTKAEYELNIISPFLRKRAIETDKIVDLIEQYAPKITISIYTDPTLNHSKFQEFNYAKSLLEKAGAAVYLTNNVHSKIITVDRSTIIEGSFNWLSAARSGKFVREECSIIYTGKKVSEFIRKSVDPIKAKISNIPRQA